MSPDSERQSGLYQHFNQISIIENAVIFRNNAEFPACCNDQRYVQISSNIEKFYALQKDLHVSDNFESRFTRTQIKHLFFQILPDED